MFTTLHQYTGVSQYFLKKRLPSSFFSVHLIGTASNVFEFTCLFVCAVCMFDNMMLSSRLAFAELKEAYMYTNTHTHTNISRFRILHYRKSLRKIVFCVVLAYFIIIVFICQRGCCHSFFAHLSERRSP